MRYRLDKYRLGTPPRRTQIRAAPPATAPTAPANGARWEPRLVVALEVSVGASDVEAELGRVLDVAVGKVESFAGRVEEAGPSRLVAAFGLDPVEDAPRRAALAAMAIRNALALRTEPRRPSVMLALHAEECAVRQVAGRVEVDGDARRRMTAVLAGLREHTEAEAIAVSPAARALLLRRFELAGGHLVGYVPEPFGADAGAAPFVGRETELQTLWARWRDACAGRGHVVALVGEPGIGKSRLLFELRRAVGDTGRYLEGRAESHGGGIPYLAVLDVLRAFFGLEERDDAEATADKVRTGLQSLDPALASDAAPLLALLGAREVGAEWQTIDPAQRRQRTLDALKRLVLRASQTRPVLLALEDLHWSDAETQAFLDRLAVSLSAARLLVVVTYRPEYRHAVVPTSLTQLHLDPLPPASAELLARSLLGSDPAVDTLAHRLIERTEGNPFFLEESVRVLVETGGLVGERGAYRPGRDVNDLDVPPTVRAVLAARLDRLTPEERHVAQAAAVIGKDVPLPLLRAVASVAEARLGAVLGELQAAELLRETNAVPEAPLTFKHALTHEVAYATLTTERRRALHARVVDALEQASADEVERLAHHALAAERWDQALVYGRQAGARAAWRSAHREAVQYFEQALAAIGKLPETAERRAQTLDLHLQTRWSLVPLGDYQRLADSLHRAAALAERLDDPRQLAEISQSMTNYLRLIGDCTGALAAGERARALAGRLGNKTLEVRSTYQLGLVHRQLGDYPRAIGALQTVVDALQGPLLHERFGEPSVLSVHARAWLAIALAEVGRVAEGLTLAEEALEIATDTRNAFSQTTAHHALGSLLARLGEVERARSVLERGLALCRDGNFLLLLPHVASALGSALTLAGRVAEALPLLELAVETAAARGLHGGASIYLVQHGRGLLRAGRTDGAAALARRARQAARERGERGHEAWALHLLAETALLADAAAAGYYAEALALAHELGMQPLVAQCRARLTELKVSA
jgi:tetratricopeptide (TPR) repeat protein